MSRAKKKFIGQEGMEVLLAAFPSKSAMARGCQVTPNGARNWFTSGWVPEGRLRLIAHNLFGQIKKKGSPTKAETEAQKLIEKTLGKTLEENEAVFSALTEAARKHGIGQPTTLKAEGDLSAITTEALLAELSKRGWGLTNIQFPRK